MNATFENFDELCVYDAIIVGAGLTGSWAAKQLAEGGLHVLLLEAGPEVRMEDLHDAEWTPERRRSEAARQHTQCQHSAYWSNNPTFFVDDIDHPYTSCAQPPFVWVRGRQVGGRSLTWSGVTLRLSDSELRAPELDGFGERWPIVYEDLAPFYSEIERFMGVQGSCESLPQLPDGHFMPAATLTNTEILFRKRIEARWPDRRVIPCRGICDAADSRPAASGVGWPQKTVLRAVLPAAAATRRVSLRPNSVVSQLTFGRDSSLTRGVSFLDRITRQRFEARARIVVLCASTLESLRIMLNSKSAQHPSGAGNSHGLLGRYLLDHASIFLGGVVPKSRGLEVLQLGGARGVLIPRFRNLSTPADGFIRGYGVWGALQRGDRAPSGDALWSLCALLEVLPYARNRLWIDDAVRDAWGIPVPKIDLEYSTNEIRMLTDAESSLREMAKTAGLFVTTRAVTNPGGYVHELGGARLGARPETSVLNPYNQCWDAPNLFVLDGACFVTAGWQNPTLTMMALAGRACTYMLKELKQNRIPISADTAVA